MKYINKLCCYFGWHEWINRSKFHRNCINCGVRQMRMHYNMKKWFDMTEWLNYKNGGKKVERR
jgi:hypothetical protein